MGHIDFRRSLVLKMHAYELGDLPGRQVGSGLEIKMIPEDIKIFLALRGWQFLDLKPPGSPLVYYWEDGRGQLYYVGGDNPDGPFPPLFSLFHYQQAFDYEMGVFQSRTFFA